MTKLLFEQFAGLDRVFALPIGPRNTLQQHTD